MLPRARITTFATAILPGSTKKHLGFYRRLFLLRRFRAIARECLESATFEAAALPSRLSAFSVACERFRDGLCVWLFSASASSRFACSRVFSGTLPFAGTGNCTPARRALESPIAIACLVERTPCSPLRIASISSRTNSPACVEGDFPSRSARRARTIVSFFGMIISSIRFRQRSRSRTYFYGSDPALKRISKLGSSPGQHYFKALALLVAEEMRPGSLSILPLNGPFEEA